MPRDRSSSRSHRHRSYNSPDMRQVSSDDRTLPVPNTYSEHKRGEKRNHGNGKMSRYIKPAGESGRKGFHPIHFSKISFRSTSRASLLCNFLWPFVPAAIAVRYAMPDNHITIFALAYIAMVPCANLIGFAGQELSRKLPHVLGVLLEITIGSIVEIILFMVLLSKDMFFVIKAAIMGSILATMLLCLGACFFVGGMLKEEQEFNEAISEAGSGLLLTAGVVLALPTVFEYGVGNGESLTAANLDHKTLQISRIISVLLIIAYLVYVFYQARTHHGIYAAVFEQDEHNDRDKHKDQAKAKLTLTECIIALVIAVGLVAWTAVILVMQIEHVIERGDVSDAFMGLILVPLVEKLAEHLTAIDEAWDNQINLAMSHVLGATLQTALFNAPLAVVVSWGLNKGLDLNFAIFDLVMLILAILTVGRFLQDQKSNYLEGFLLIILYVAIAVAAYYYPNPTGHGSEGGGESSSEGGH
ncbi:Sodium/calcium exchanger protein-domain-containing protein [Fusarium sp. MPI-SDFR-AT-0072]|uniref:Vacuolar calcium ion transporter n=1 Tax=Fusarium oxysporum f. sp. rapae TaxID=485398 RepID=A0A8J5P742_FUSOX|nr:Vacuolar cation/proton exchanger 2 [Fusarium oxysporum f. sp. rapae]KAH7178444.1 Sodium/calcium exchanger protein-domain-containing protein [Fusarium sp. MPI-SDFR-AT-0072]